MIEEIERDRQTNRLNDLQNQQGSECFLTPTAGRCIIVRDGFTYSGLIHIPDKHKQFPTTGRVVAVADDDHKFLLGKRVAWGRYSGLVLQFAGKPTFDVMTYEEIIAYINDDNVKLDIESLAGLNRE